MQDYRRKIFGDLTVLKHNTETSVLVVCYCGKNTCKQTVNVNVKYLDSGKVRSCSDVSRKGKVLSTKPTKKLDLRGLDAYYVDTVNAMASHNARVDLNKTAFKKLARSNCDFCGAKAETHRRYNTRCNYVTRIDNKKSMSKTNVIVMCPDCRTCRNGATLGQWFNRMKTILFFIEEPPVEGDKHQALTGKNIVKRKIDKEVT